MSFTHLQLRKAFSKFWEEKPREHKLVEPVSLILGNDSTTLFTGSGMQPLVPNLLGEPHPLGKKLYNIQPCFRSQDIEEVGDNRHTTFFEMMGNWSLGTYFKKEQLEWCWKFFTEELNLSKEQLHVTVFEGDSTIPADDESYEIWKKLGIPRSQIHKYGVEKNWWSRAGVPDAMPAGEPGGPDSEVFFEFNNVKHDKKFGQNCHPNCECGRFLEIGNSVFMQYKKNKDGSFSELPNKNVDFGGGLERILAVVNNTPDVFQTDAYRKIIRAVEETSGKKYSDERFAEAIRVVSDHLKAATFLVKNNVLPSNKEQGYVLRRLLRRVAVKYRLMTNAFRSNDMSIVARSVLSTYENIYFEIKTDEVTISRIIDEEMKRFSHTLERGLKEIQKLNSITGKQAFDFYQSYGFPFEVTQELFREKGVDISEEEFQKAVEKHRELSRTSAAGKFKGGLADKSKQTVKYHTATHLIHQALFDVLGIVRQEGSNITTERLRFDFSSEKKPSPEQIGEVEKIVNQKVKEALPVRFVMMPKNDAYKIGARAFSKEKYGDTVKVYYVGGTKPADAYSKEFCGGPHVTNTKEIGRIEIYKFEKIGSNLYRVYAR